jgi:beta-1,2-mannobiose phosphorylase / 1,2-beta-oligomannan phosphorylase
VVLDPANVSSSRSDFEVIGVFNPGVAIANEETLLLVRVAERPREQQTGYTALPRWNPGGEITVDWVRNDELDFIDSRVVRRKSDGRTRLTFISHLRASRSSDGLSFLEHDGASFNPSLLLEEFGVEDPRITPLDGRFYITYVAVSRHGVATALASTLDFESFDRHGVIFGPENKDVVLFPEQIGGQFLALHRPSGGAGFCRPEMWLARSPDLIHWGKHQHLLSAGADWDNGRIGAGPPPLRIPEGWLVIYHGATQANFYSAGALLLDDKDPSRVLARSEKPILIPQTDFECNGFVPNVVFPTGVVAQDRTLFVYYGAGDTVTAVVQLSLDDVLATLRR